jgi:hypothetical protein
LSHACTPVREKDSPATSRDDADAGESAAAAGKAGGNAGADSGARADEEPTNTSGPQNGSAGQPAAPGSGGRSNDGTDNSAAGKAGGTSRAGSGGIAPAAGSGGSAGSTPTLGPVRGVLIDTRRRPLTNVALRIGDQNVTTDGLGKFSADNVAATYDVSFKLSTIVDRMPATHAWRFEGLTRRDPTLQTYVAAEQQLAGLVWHTRGATFPLADDQRIEACFGSPDGDFQAGVNTADYDSPLVYWSGPPTTVGVTHGLLYTVTGPEELPLEYLAHDAKPVTLTVGGSAEATFDFANMKPPSGAIAGRVSAAGQGARENWIMVRWNDGAQIFIADDESPLEAFSYLVPTIANASAALVAMQGRYDTYPRAVAFADNLSAGQAGIQIDIPTASSLSAPGDGTMRVDAATRFEWSGDAKVFVLAAKAKQGFDRMYVVTSAKQAKLPIGEASAYTPPAGTTFEWYVETHGPYANIDEAAGSDGLISAFFDGALHGPRRGNGSFTVSALRTFVTTP